MGFWSSHNVNVIWAGVTPKLTLLQVDTSEACDRHRLFVKVLMCLLECLHCPCSMQTKLFAECNHYTRRLFNSNKQGVLHSYNSADLVTW